MAKLKNYNGRYCESEYESAFIAFLQSVGWTYLPGNKIKRCYRDVLIADDFRAFITKANTDLLEEEIEQIYDTVRLVGAESDFATLHKVYKWMVDGIQFTPGETESEAAHYLAEMAEKYAGELEILVTGSVTNLYGAWKHNPEFFHQVKSIVLMGGTTEPLIFAKREMDELNFSCDPLATYTTLTSGTDVAVITGNNCLKVLFTREEYERELSDLSKGVVRLIKNETDYWFDNNWDEYGIPGYYNWDAIAAAYMMHPELFEIQRVDMQLSTEKLTKGRLILAEDETKKNCTLKIPVIRDADEFRRNLYDTWMNVEIETVK